MLVPQSCRNLACLEKALRELGRITPVLVLMDASWNYPPGANHHPVQAIQTHP